MIKGWKRPDLGHGPLRSLNDALHDLHARSGYRSSREIEKWIKADQGRGGVSHTTIHKMFTSAELPKPELVHWVVKVLLDHSRVSDPNQVHDDFDALWNEAFEAQRREQQMLRARQRDAEQPARLPQPLDPVVAFESSPGSDRRGSVIRLLARLVTSDPVATTSRHWVSSP